MALLKKVNPDWQPAEKSNLAVGETIEVTDYENLVKSGFAVLVDEKGNEMELPGQEFNCPVCFLRINGLLNFTTHVSTHLKSKSTSVSEQTKEEVSTVTELEDKRKTEIRAKRLLALEKARQARKAKSENKTG